MEAEWLPCHPPAGAFTYRHWLGIVASEKTQDGLKRLADCVESWRDRALQAGLPVSRPRLLVAGWSMDNMKPRDFSFSTAPFIDLPGEAAWLAPGMVVAAEQFALALHQSLRPVLADGQARERVREEFYLRTQPILEQQISALQAEALPDEVARAWRDGLAREVKALFDQYALPGLADRDVKDQETILKERRFLFAALKGSGKFGRAAYDALDLPIEQKKPRRTAAAASKGKATA